jgi:hypothetical protein
MALVDSLVFTDLIVTVILIVIALTLAIYLTNLLMRLAIINYRASIGTYLFTQCLTGNITGVDYLSHVVITRGGLRPGNYLIICPIITSDGLKINVTVYTAYTG